MRLSSLLGSTAADFVGLAQLSIVLTCFAQHVAAVTYNAIPTASLDLTRLGRVGLAGDFNGISLYQYEGQSENASLANGSNSVLSRLPNGAFTSLASADASINSMCSFVMSNGNMAGIIVGGNFTSLGGMESQAIALLNPNTSAVTPLTGISGKVAAVLCDQTSNTVYVGGSFTAANSTNAIAWVGTAGWTNLPFQGFNGPVTSITRAPNGHVIFGGSFTALGNTTAPSTRTPDAQVVNIAGADITATPTIATAGFDNPTNIVCKDGGTGGVNNTWLLADSATGSWQAQFGFGFQPTKLRLWNTHQDGRGTKTWRFTAMPINGIMNFTYTDPDTGINNTCTSECPLSNSSTVKFQDFYFVNVIGMNQFRIDISAFYGSGAGLNGIELFQNDIFSYAINDFNEPTCANITTASTATTTGPWVVTPSRQSAAEYLSVNLTTGYDPAAAQVIFLPNIKQSGNYTVNMYTPGCIQDDTCGSRQQVNVTGTMASGTTRFQTSLFQSNNFDKYDEIYSGYVEAGSTAFRPSVTLRPVAGQNAPLTVVASRVGFVITSSASEGGLNSIFEWDPTLAVANTSDFSTSVFDLAGVSIGTGGGVNALATSGSITYVGGNFSTTAFDNILAVNATGSGSLANGGLNGPVISLLVNGTTLYVAGNFSNTKTTSTTGLNNIAAYDTSRNAWSAMGAGVNGKVEDVVALSMNISGSTPETVLTLTGAFSQLNAFGTTAAASADGFAIWVPSRSNWLQNLNLTTMLIQGRLTAETDVAFGGTLFAGSLSTAQFGVNGVVEVANGITTFPIRIQAASSQSTSNLAKRATVSQNVTGVITGLFHETASGLNITVLGGRFSATATNGSTINNLAFINGSSSDAVTGLGSQLSSSSSIYAMAMANNTLFAGGNNGLITVDLYTATVPIQPPALGGAVNTVAVRPDSSEVYVGGSFGTAGALNCPGVCLFDTKAVQWTRPGTTLQGTANTMMWASPTSLIVGGSLLVSGTNSSLVQYDAQAYAWTAFNGASAIPGPVAVMTAANSDASRLWVAGTATNGSTFLMMYDGTNWNSLGYTLGSSTIIRGLQILPLNTSHASTAVVPAAEVLMLTGSINLPNFGNASAVSFNGTNFVPFALTTSSRRNSGSLSQVFSQQQNFFTIPSSGLALGFIVLIGLGCALGVIFLIVVAGVLLERYRRRKEGYMPAPTNMYDKTTQMSRVPPEQLFGSVNRGPGGAPMI